MWRYSQCRHRICNDRQSSAAEFQKYCFLFLYSTVRYMVIARLCLSLQLRWRHWEYRHMACSDLSNIQANLVSFILLRYWLPWLVRAWPSSGHLLASSNFNFNMFISIYDIIHPLYKIASSLCEHMETRLVQYISGLSDEFYTTFSNYFHCNSSIVQTYNSTARSQLSNSTYGYQQK